MTRFAFAQPGAVLGRPLRYLRSWWYLVHLTAVALVTVLSPASWRRDRFRATARYIHSTCWQVLPWFALATALVSLVVIRIVLVTASSYGLSQFALEMMVRVLVLELIPLCAALFVALRASMAFDASAQGLVRAGLSTHAASEATMQRLRRDLVPQLIANAVAVLTLALLTSVIVLVLAYLNVYGVSPWGIDAYTRTVGRVFAPTVSAGFVLKTALFGLAVALVPSAAMLELQRYPRRLRSSVQPGAVRLLFVLFVIEAASLAIKYI